MHSTMQDFPLTLAAIVRHACGIHGARTVTTATGDGYRQITYRELGRAGRQLANALRRIGITGDQRVAHVHVEQRRTPGGLPGGAVDGRGAAHPQHPAVPRADRLRRQRGRGPGDPGRHVAGRTAGAGAAAARHRAHRDRGRRGRPGAAAGVGQDRAALRRGDRPASPPNSTGRRSTRTPRPRCATPAAPPATPKAWSTAIVRAICTPWRTCTANGIGLGAERQRAADRADVPRQRLGAAVRGADGGRGPGVARSPPGRAVADRHGRKAAAHGGRRGADYLERRHALPGEEPRTTTCRRCGWWSAAARRFRCR